MWVLFGIIGLIYITVRIVKEESGNGDMWRRMGDIYKDNPEMKKAYYKKGSDSDGAVGCSVVILGFIAIVVILALCGFGS